IRSLGAGSQLLSLSAPGLFFWMYSVSDPSEFFFMFGIIGELMRYRLIGFLISSCVLPSYIVTDQKAFTGGNCPAANVSVYLFLLPSSGSPLTRVLVMGYMASAASLP